MKRKVRRKSTRLILTLMALLTALVVLPMSVAGASSAGFPMYSWGNNSQGHLGLGDNIARNVPIRVGGDTDWMQVASASSTSVAINVDGELFTWGANWNAVQMGQGAHPSPGTGHVTVPTRVGEESNWTWVAARGAVAGALNSHGHIYIWGTGIGGGNNVPTRVAHDANFAQMSLQASFAAAITDEGYLYTWGANDDGQLGHGDTIARNIPTRVGDEPNWATVLIGSQMMIALTKDGHMYTWGGGGNSGRLGHGDTAPRHVPTRVDVPGVWVSVGATTANAVAAINQDGELWTWGSNSSGQLGRGAGGNSLSPERVGTESSWNFLSSANSHFIATNHAGEVWSWGNNGDGQLGIGEFGGYRNTPQFVLQSSGFAGTAIGGGQRSFMLMFSAPIVGEADIQKRLEKPEGTVLLDDLTFNFAFERNSFNNNEAQYTQVPIIPDRSITLNAASFSPPAAGGVTTTLDILNVLEGVEFIQNGVFSWIVTELPTTGVSPPSNVIDSQAKFELRVYVAREGDPIAGDLYIAAIIITKLYTDEGIAVNPPQKVDNFTFVNTYTRTAAGGNDGALVVSKTVTGAFADITIPFDFEITLTQTVFCPEATTFSAQIFEGNTAIGSPITFISDVEQTVQLTHGQRLVFDDFLVGTRFTVTEIAHTAFAPSVVLTVNGVGVTVPPPSVPGEDLSIGGPHIAGDGENRAAFINAYTNIPTGLWVSGPSLTIPLMVAAIGLVAFFAPKYRRRIEELPPI